MALRTRNVVRLTLFMLCLAGAWISGELVKEHAGPWPSLEVAGGQRSLFARLCGEGPGTESGCAAVLKSEWSAIDFDVPLLTRGFTIRRARVVMPVAFIGLAYFVFLGVWYALAGPPRSWGRWSRYVPLIVVTCGACGSITLLWVIIFKLKSHCAWCIVTHAINGLLLLGTLAVWPRRPGLVGEMAPGRRRNDVSAYTLTPAAAFRITGFAVLVIVGLWMYRGAKLETRQQVARLLPYKKFVVQRKDDPAFLVREYLAGPRQAIPVSTSADGAGLMASVPTVTIFTDFQCPHCACFARKWEMEYRRRWQGPIRVTLRHLPLRRECNEAVSLDLHPEACAASYAAEAARLQGGDEAFWKMHDLLFASNRRLSRKPYAKLATRIGLNGEQLLADMEGEEVRLAVARDVALAAELGVNETPTVFLNGRHVPELCLYNPVFWEAVSADFLQSERLADHPPSSPVPKDVDAIARSGGIDP